MFKIDSAKLPDGTLMTFGIRYPEMQSDPEKVFTYAFLKAGGQFYGTGTGKVPQAAGWGAVDRWLNQPGREVLWVRYVTETAQVYPSPMAPEPSEVVRSLTTLQ